MFARRLPKSTSRSDSELDKQPIGNLSGCRFGRTFRVSHISAASVSRDFSILDSGARTYAYFPFCLGRSENLGGSTLGAASPEILGEAFVRDVFNTPVHSQRGPYEARRKYALDGHDFRAAGCRVCLRDVATGRSTARQPKKESASGSRTPR